MVVTLWEGGVRVGKKSREERRREARTEQEQKQHEEAAEGLKRRKALVEEKAKAYSEQEKAYNAKNKLKREKREQVREQRRKEGLLDAGKGLIRCDEEILTEIRKLTKINEEIRKTSGYGLTWDKKHNWDSWKGGYFTRDQYVDYMEKQGEETPYLIRVVTIDILERNRGRTEKQIKASRNYHKGMLNSYSSNGYNPWYDHRSNNIRALEWLLFMEEEIKTNG